jgi:hypothetical protein
MTKLGGQAADMNKRPTDRTHERSLRLVSEEVQAIQFTLSQQYRIFLSMKTLVQPNPPQNAMMAMEPMGGREPYRYRNNPFAPPNTHPGAAWNASRVPEYYGGGGVGLAYQSNYPYNTYAHPSAPPPHEAQTRDTTVRTVRTVKDDYYDDYEGDYKEALTRNDHYYPAPPPPATEIVVTQDTGRIFKLDPTDPGGYRDLFIQECSAKVAQLTDEFRQLTRRCDDLKFEVRPLFSVKVPHPMNRLPVWEVTNAIYQPHRQNSRAATWQTQPNTARKTPSTLSQS